MVDIETYGTAETAVVREISVIPFQLNPAKVYHGALLDIYPFVDKQKEDNRTSDIATMAWWKTRPNVDSFIRERENQYGMSPAAAAIMLVDYIDGLKKKYSVRFIGRGATTFDIPILQNFCKQYGKELKIPFYRIYDLRSVTSVFKLITGIDLVEKAPESATHLAVDDCRAQISQLFQFAKECGGNLPAIEDDLFTMWSELSGKDKK